MATGKSVNHIASVDTCQTCHTTVAWTPALFDHAGVVKGTCATCHNGVNASGKPVTHIPTTQSCDTCHSTLVWKPATFSHTGITTGCSVCHNGTSATGKNTGHMSTLRECNVCHTTSVWTPISFKHTSTEYPGDHSTRLALTCLSCHTTNTDAATWKTPSYRPNCAGCHAGNYKSDPHTKVTNVSKYTVGELQNCTGACHIYTDATLTKIKTTRNSHHKVTDTSFSN